MLQLGIKPKTDQEIDVDTKKALNKIQHDLFTLGAMLATPPEKETLKSGKERLNIPKISNEDIELLEQEMDNMNEALPPMTHFILPGGHPTVSYCHVARTVCRRAERMITYLNENEPVDPLILVFINISSLASERANIFTYVYAKRIHSEKSLTYFGCVSCSNNIIS